MRTRKWSEDQLRIAVKRAKSVRQVLSLIGLRVAGGNYKQIAKYLKFYKIDTSHFWGQAWNKGLKGIGRPIRKLDEILVKGSTFQTYQLKKRLFNAGLKVRSCELCGWAEYSMDGRLPLELDHINGDCTDNRLENLRVLCPNCHSLQPTHRGKNRMRHQASVVKFGNHVRLKI
jgi:hypothetical protein